MKKQIWFLFFMLIPMIPALAQEGPETDSIEVSIIDSYVTPDTPPKLLLSFFTSDTCKSKLVIEGKGEYPISDTYTDNHRLELDISGLHIKASAITYYFLLQNSAGKIQKSEKYEVEMPVEQAVEDGGNFITTCLFGGVIFLTPSPVYVFSKNSAEKSMFGLSKEIPLFTFFSGGYNYPVGYFSAEYSHIFKSDSKFTPKNTLRIGYKHIVTIPVFEYLSAGVSGYTNFKGFNGISPEFSVGLFNMNNVFTVFAKYRFNLQPKTNDTQFHEISLGLFSSFFSLHL